MLLVWVSACVAQHWCCLSSLHTSGEIWLLGIKLLCMVHYYLQFAYLLLRIGTISTCLFFSSNKIKFVQFSIKVFEQTLAYCASTYLRMQAGAAWSRGSRAGRCRQHCRDCFKAQEALACTSLEVFGLVYNCKIKNMFITFRNSQSFFVQAMRVLPHLESLSFSPLIFVIWYET